MKKQKKRTLRPQELWNPGAVEQWLENEAAKGWRLTDCNGWFATFEAAEPKACRVRVHPQGPEAREAFLERIAAYEEMGWHYAAAIEHDFEIFYCDNPAVPELDTDPVAYGWAWEKQLKRAWRNGWLLLLVPLVILVLPWITRKTLLDTLLSMPLVLLFAAVVLVPLVTVLCARQLWTVRKLRCQITAGVKPGRDGNWRKDRRWWRIATLLYVVYWVLYVFGNAGWAVVAPDTSGMPYVAATELAPKTVREDWAFEVEGYVRRSTPLNPAREESQLCAEGQRRVRNTGDRVQFEFLAKALYREKVKEFREDWPEAEEIAVEHDAFDEAVLLTGGENVQMLLVRAGKIVYSLWVNFPADLSGSIEAVAADLSA